jgi:retinol dehydrogenase-12
MSKFGRLTWRIFRASLGLRRGQRKSWIGWTSVRLSTYQPSVKPKLKAVLLNAGVAVNGWITTKDGFETQLQVNDLASGLLAVLLLPFMQKTAQLPSPSTSSSFKPHLTFTASDAHFFTSFPEGATPHPLATLSDPNQFRRFDRYNVTKLINIFLARELAKLAGPNIVVNSVNPGLCRSEFFRHASVLLPFIATLAYFLGRTSEEGSRTIIWALLNETPAGAYSNSCASEE